jgi:hypothetical protein
MVRHRLIKISSTLCSMLLRVRVVRRTVGIVSDMHICTKVSNNVKQCLGCSSSSGHLLSFKAIAFPQRQVPLIQKVELGIRFPS